MKFAERPPGYRKSPKSRRLFISYAAILTIIGQISAACATARGNGIKEASAPTPATCNDVLAAVVETDTSIPVRLIIETCMNEIRPLYMQAQAIQQQLASTQEQERENKRRKNYNEKERAKLKALCEKILNIIANLYHVVGNNSQRILNNDDVALLATIRGFCSAYINGITQ